MIPSSWGLWFWCAAALGSGVLLFLCPAAAAAGVARGLQLCVQSVVPALFPYMVITTLLLAQPQAVALLSVPVRPLGRLMGQRDKTFCTVLLLCALGGFASAANCIACGLREGRLTQRQGQMLCFCGLYASPAFVCNVVGPPLGPGAGRLLFGAGVAAGLGCCLLAPLFCPSKAQGPLPHLGLSAPAQASPSPAQAVEQATLIMVKICGFVVFFSFWAEVFGRLLPRWPALTALLGSLLEMTGGCEACLALKPSAALYASRAALSWLGLCALCQVDSILPPSLPRSVIYLGRLVHMGLSLLFLRLFLFWLPREAPVYSSLAPRLIPYTRLEPDAALVLFLLCCLVLFRLEKETRHPKSISPRFTFGKGRL